MAEAVAAIGLAASLVPLVEAGTKVIARLHEFRSAATGMPGAFRDIMIQLPLIMDIVSQIGKGCEDGTLVVEAQHKLSLVVRGCCNQIDALDVLIVQMLPASTDSKFRRARKVLVSLLREREVAKIQSVLEEYKSTLMLYTAMATQKRQAAMIQEDLKHRCQVWLQPLPNVRDFHERRFKTKLGGTCDWVWKNPTFIDWGKTQSILASDRLLCIYGTHGCGKTVLASSIIEGLKTKQLQTLFFYFSGADPNLQSLDAVIRTLLWQLLEFTTDKRSLEVVGKLALNGPPTYSELLDALTSVAASVVGPVYCVIDGVDESNTSTREFLQQVLHILESHANFRAVLLGRKHVFQAATSVGSWAIEINSNLIRQDIDALINSEVDTAVDADFLRLPGLRHSIVETLREKSDGMLLWVKLMVDDLRRAATQFEIKESLRNLPRGLEEAYRRIFLRLIGTLNDSELARVRKMMAFAIVSCRPLGLDEMRYAYALDSRSCATFEEHMLTPPVQKILDVCGNFIDIENNLVQLVHISIKEFLIRPEDEWLRSGDGKIADFRVDPIASHFNFGFICFDYLRSTEYGYPLQDCEGTNDSFLELGIKYPFLKYASRYMICHLSWSGPPCSATLDKLRDFLRSEKSLPWVEYLAMLFLENGSGNTLPDDLERFISWLDTGMPQGELFKSELGVCLDQELTKRIREFGERDPRVGQCRFFLDFLGVVPGITSAVTNSEGEATSLQSVREEDFNPSLLNALASSSPLPLHQQFDLFLKLQSHLKQVKVLTSPLKILFRIILQKAPIIPIYVLLAIGEFYARLDKLEEALEVYHAALAKVEDQEILLKFRILRNIGINLERQGKYEAAEEMYRRSLEGMEKVLGKDHRDALGTMASLGDALYNQEKYEAAEEMYQRALEGMEKVLGKEHRDTSATAIGLGDAIHCQDKYKAAEETYRRALKGMEKVLGKDHHDAAADLGDVLYAQEKYEAAEEMYRRALEGMKKVLGKDHGATLGIMANLGKALYSQGKLEAAEEMYRQANQQSAVREEETDRERIGGSPSSLDLGRRHRAGAGRRA
ncbi:MAG: hypothetical protein M1839_003091 [Geoglossum umbratile]|nr:MAG: hypothetical protein M1839_003091 [Geoglossum umbratile]